MSRRVNQRGTTLPLVLLVIVLLGMGLAFSFRRTGSELRTYSDQQAQVDASVLAQSGIALFLGSLTAIPASGSVDTTIALTGGTAVLKLRRLRDSTGLPGDIYALTVSGVSTGSTSYGSQVPTAQHAIAQILMVPSTVLMNVKGAYTSLNSVTSIGLKPQFDGTGAPSVAGVAVPTGGWSTNANGAQIVGNPNGVPANLGTQAQANAAVGIDWDGMINGGKITPDYSYSDCSSLPLNMASYPIVVVTGDCVISGGKTFNGTLIVTGNLTLSKAGGSDPQMNGIILVGKTFKSLNAPQTWGTVLTGLNKLVPSMPQPVGIDTINSSAAQYWYDKTKVGKAATRFISATATLTVIRNAIADNIPTW